MATESREMRTLVDVEAQPYRYYRNAVERHWDPFDIDLDRDRENLLDYYSGEDALDFDDFKRGIARFGAGEESVTEDLAPLTVVLEDIEDQMYVTTQIYEEAKHTELFDRYWREVVHPVERELGQETSSPLEDRWFNESYDELFERNERAMHRLLEDDTVENRARAFCHYHLTIEGILAQTGYYGLQTIYGEDDYPELPHLPGLYEGLSYTRADEGRHVGFGLYKLKQMVGSEEIDVSLINETVAELLPLVNGIVDEADPEGPGMHPDELVGYASEKHVQRIDQITRAADLPDVEQLVSL